MSPSADRLLQLMKHQVDATIAKDEKLQQFLMWVNEKSLSVHSVEVSYKLAAVRSFYLAPERLSDTSLKHAQTLVLDHALICVLDIALELYSTLDGILDWAANRAYDLALTLEDDIYPNIEIDLSLLDFNRALDLDPDFDHALDLELALDINLNRALLAIDLDPQLIQELQHLKDQLTDSQGDREKLAQWWQAQGWDWTKQLRALMIQYGNIGHDWQFSWQQEELLKHYYDANLFLLECLNSDCYVSREVRSHIEDTLLLPIAEIENRKPTW